MAGYVGSERWKKDCLEAYAAFSEFCTVNQENGVRFMEAEAGTGSRYVVVGTPLDPVPAARMGGGSMLITVCTPWQSTYVLQPSGLLHMRYVLEKFVPVQEPFGGDLVALTMAIGRVMNRPVGGFESFLLPDDVDA